ncbi:MAG: asparaginase domain-containing protein [Spirochaetota bacterium]
MSEAIRLIITGGTFDKQYDELRGELTFRTSHLPEILERVRVTVPVELEINELVDSLHMKESDRARIADSCARSPERRIVITHGTDTMVETAAVIGARALDRVVVLTGAMVPYAFSGTDAVFNLGCAVAAAQTLERGVYIAMNGRIFAWDHVRKNRERGIFETIDEPVQPATPDTAARRGRSLR